MAEVATLPDRARYSLRGDSAMLAQGCAAFGLPCPAALWSESSGDRTALRLGPDEILLIGPAGAPAPTAGSVVDVSGRQIGLTLTGDGSAVTLAAGCPLDLDRFEVGACTRTLLGKAEIVLWRTGPLGWHVEVWRSFAPYVRALLAQAGRDWAA
jgi:sarcosine oxidase subunit gamma